MVWRLQAIRSKPARSLEPVGGAWTGAGGIEAARLTVSRAKLFLGFISTAAYACLFERVGFFLATLLFMFGWYLVRGCPLLMKLLFPDEHLDASDKKDIELKS